MYQVSNLSNFKSKLDALHDHKLVPVLVDLSKLIYVVKTDVVKKDVYDAKIKNIEGKIPNITKLAKSTTDNAKKKNQIQGEIPSITNLATTPLLLLLLLKIKYLMLVI